MKVFLGPCMLESWDLCEVVATELVRLQKIFPDLDIHFKGSFDKANRSSIDSKRGPGIELGLDYLKRVKKDFGLKTITDFHSGDQADRVAEVVDVLQVPAFLCRQTDVIIAGSEACKKYDRILKVKKGQFLSPEEAKNIVDKASSILPKDKILLTERGTSFGYNCLVVDMGSFSIMNQLGVETIHDATHCVQRPGGRGTSTGGRRELIIPLARAAMAAGAKGLFLEAHPNPEKALSDSATQMPLEKLEGILKELTQIKRLVDGF